MLQTPPAPVPSPSASAAAALPSLATPPPGNSQAAAVSSAPAIEEVVTRPEPGLRRGKYEARPWHFGLLMAVAVLFVLGYLARRFSWNPLRKKPSTP
jgi:hypothetical protein